MNIKILAKIPIILFLSILLSGVAWAQRKVHFVGDFETGQIQPKDTMHDGFYVHTLPNPQSGATSVVSPNSTFGPTSGHDTRVVRSEVVGSETITPRSGNYFIRASVYFNKDYTELNGGQPGDIVLNKPRAKIYMSDPEHRIDHDLEGYVGFSIYTPKNFEHELGVRDHRGGSMLFVINSTASRTHVALSQYVQTPATEAHWFLYYNINATSTNEPGSTTIKVDLGPVIPDLGKWTDFVVHYRFNPFSVATNPAAAGIANSKNQLYQGNKGIMQVWKAEGVVDPSGNRKMVLKIDKVNTPIGLVPHATDKLIHYWRIYKYGWHHNPTTVKGPVWYGFDEIRQGLVLRDGTGYADVAPSGGLKLSAPGGLLVK